MMPWLTSRRTRRRATNTRLPRLNGASSYRRKADGRGSKLRITVRRDSSPGGRNTSGNDVRDPATAQRAYIGRDCLVPLPDALAICLGIVTVLFSRPLYYAWRLLLHVIDVVRYDLRRPLVIDVFDSGRIALVSCCSVPNVQGFFAWPPSNPAGPMPSGEGSGARQIQADMPPISPRGMLSRWQSPDHLGNRAIGNTRRQTAVRGKGCLIAQLALIAETFRTALLPIIWRQFQRLSECRYLPTKASMKQRPKGLT